MEKFVKVGDVLRFGVDTVLSDQKDQTHKFIKGQLVQVVRCYKGFGFVDEQVIFIKDHTKNGRVYKLIYDVCERVEDEYEFLEFHLLQIQHELNLLEMKKQGIITRRNDLMFYKSIEEKKKTHIKYEKLPEGEIIHKGTIPVPDYVKNLPRPFPGTTDKE